MISEAVSPLRRRMIEDMTIRQFGGKTKSDYIRQVREFTIFLGRSPDRAEPEDLRRYQLHLASCGASYARMNLAATALRFFFHTTLGRTGFGDRMARIPTPDRLPVVLSPEEVALLLAHAPSLKYCAALSLAYGCGLRASEIANLKVAVIDSARMLIRVEQGKGRKDRFAMLAPDLLDLLRQWWRVPASVAAVAFQNKAVVYDILLRTAADTLLTIAADPKHLGAKIGLTAVLHTWGSAMTHHPHVHLVVPGGGLSPDGARWIACRPGFFLPVRVLSRLFRRLFLDRLAESHRAGRLAFHGELAALADADAFAAHLAPMRRTEWVVYAKRPFAGPEAVLAYLSPYTHRVAIANSRLLPLDEHGVTFRWKDYRARDGTLDREWIKTLTLAPDEFIRRFLLHVLPDGFHRIRHYGLFAAAGGRPTSPESAACSCPRRRRARPLPSLNPLPSPGPPAGPACPCCGGRMIVVERFRTGEVPRLRPSAVGLDTS